MPLKIGLVLDDTLDKPDGVQQYVQTLGRWLTNQGHEVHYLVGESKRTDYPNVHSLARNIPVSFNGNHMTIPLPASRTRIRKLLGELQLDVLHVQTPHSPFMGQRVVLAARPETAVVATFHVLPYSWLVTTATRLLALWLRPSLKRIGVLIANSKPTQVFAERAYKMPSVVIPNPFELAQFEGAEPFPEYADKLTIVYLNRLVARKGAIHLLEAVAYLRDHKLFEETFQVLVCGKGEEAPRLEQYVREHQLGDLVKLAGFVSEADKPRYLASSDLTVYPSTSGESFGIVLLEGMATSKGAVLAGDNPGYASVMAPRPEQIVDPKDTAAFAELIAAFLHDPAKRQAAAQWQREYVQQFDINVVGAELVRTYNSLVTK